MNFIFLILTPFIFNLYHITNQLSSYIDSTEEEGDIVVYLDKIVQNKGDVYIGLFNSKKTFRKINKVYKYEKVRSSKEESVVVLEDIPYDEYAVVVFQDFNGNQKFDKNFLGLPKEPFGFSTNFIVSKRAPKYHEVTFIHNDEDTELKVFLQQF